MHRLVPTGPCTVPADVKCCAYASERRCRCKWAPRKRSEESCSAAWPARRASSTAGASGFKPKEARDPHFGTHPTRLHIDDHSGGMRVQIVAADRATMEKLPLRTQGSVTPPSRRPFCLGKRGSFIIARRLDGDRLRRVARYWREGKECVRTLVGQRLTAAGS
jgi:hypothetical protein